MRRIALSAALIALALAVPAAAQQGHLLLQEDPISNYCEFTVQPPGQVRLAYLVASSGIPFNELRFNVTPPACSGFTFLAVVPDELHIATGDLINGFVVTGPCVTSGIVATVTYLTTITPSPCCEWRVEPWPSSPRGEIELVGCDGFVAFAEAHPASLNGYCLCDIYDYAVGPYKPTPADGATDVPLNAQLAWELDCCPSMIVWLSDAPFTGYPSDKIVYDGDLQNPFDPGILQPNTTYYWRVSEYASGVSYEGYEGDSRIWSFTTGDVIVPVERATWGGIKALYR